MIERCLKPILLECMADYPGVLMVGARQSGKTTLAKSLGGEYFDLEQESERLRLDLAWEIICNGNQCVILDEAQAWPEVFPRLRGAIDADRSRAGRFLLIL
jgi:predicted AAA+ superfamily ATPase